MVKVGDQVRFLNEVGGGIVLSVSGAVATIEDADGFAVPVSVSECVVVKEKAADPESFQSHPVDTDGDHLSVALGFAREDSGYNIHMSNEGAYCIFFQFLTKLKDAGYRVCFSGVLQAGICRRIGFLSSAETNDICRKYVVRILPYKEKGSFDLKPVYDISRSIDPKRLSKTSSYYNDTRFPVPVCVVELVSSDTQVETTDEELLSEAFAELPRQDAVKVPCTKKFLKGQTLEIDLHASDILETTAGMSSGDILEYQLDYFVKIMDRHYGKSRGLKIIFIHGKGEGVLRKSMLRLLAFKYPLCHAEDAPFNKYSFGATVVTF